MGWKLRLSFFVLFIILFSFSAQAYWQTYQNDLRNSGASNGTGYFPLMTSNFSNDDFGMDFQPLIGDLDGKGSSKIVIFSNNSLIIFNRELEIMKKIKVGGILGQPALFDYDNDGLNEIIFNAEQNTTDYFFAYNYNNSNLSQKFNISLSNKANFSGIKCLHLDLTPICVFKDTANYVHIINLNSKVDDFYFISDSNERFQTVPAIGDIDNDGSTEAVFWLNNDSIGSYGLAAFDLSNRSMKRSFGINGIIKDVFFPSLENAFTLKGHPVLVDLNNDRKLEVAVSVFYDSSLPAGEQNTDRYTELFVYDANGTKLFSKCEVNTVLNSGCNEGLGNRDQWDGTNPFVIDFDKNGIDDVCFIKDVKSGGIFSYMAMNCYNYSGDEIAKVFLTGDGHGIQGNAIAADMNSDGEKDIVLRHKVYSANGTSIFKINNVEGQQLIPADLDGNNGLDLLWTSGSQTKVFLDNNNYTLDLEASAINFFKFNKTHINATSAIKNKGQAEAKNVKAVIYNTHTMENATFLLGIKKGRNVTIGAVMGFVEDENAYVIVDYDNEINESNENNNDAFKKFLGLPYVFVGLRQEEYNILSFLEPVIIDYVKNKLISGYYTDSENGADVRVYVGKGSTFNKNNNPSFRNDFGAGYDYGNVIYNDKAGINPYSAIVLGVKKEPLIGKSHVDVMVAGNEIEGDLAGIKEFIKNQEMFLNVKENEAVFVDDENQNGLKVYDYLNNDANKAHYKENSDEFKRIVGNALNDEMFSTTDRTVVTFDGVSLRLRNLRANFSNDFVQYLNSSGVPTEIPVVLARGIHSNLTSWEVLAGEFANEGRDAWLIEITGGPGQDCDTCPNYNFSDLTDNYWPALINGVLNFTGKEKIQYVGHSNGGRVAIVSLANGKVNTNKIDTLIGVAVPSAFEGYSTFGDYFGSYGGEIMNDLSDKNHVTMTEIGNKLRRSCLANFEFSCTILTLGLKSESKMSFNMDKQYYLWIINTTDEQIGKNLQLDNFYLIQGWVRDNRYKGNEYVNISHDYIVTGQDQDAIFNNIISSNKKHYKVWGAHTAGWSSVSVPDGDFTKSIIKDALNKKSLNNYKSNEINSS